MPFFARQKIVWPHFEPSFHREQRIDDDGNVQFENVSDNAPLPPPELFDLKAQIKAGVNQLDVSTKILGSGLAVAQALEQINNSDTNNLTKDEK